MKKNTILIEVLALALILTTVLAGCGGKGSSGGSASAIKNMEEFDKAMSEGNLEKALAIAKKSESKNAAQPMDFSYELTEDEKGIVITKYDGKGGKVIVPSVIENYPVVEIADWVFSGDSYYNRDGKQSANAITELVLPNTVMHIGERLVSHNDGLTTVTLPAGLKEISRFSFSTCPNLTTVNLPAKAEEILAYAFSHCSSLTTMNLPASITTIETDAFSDCSSLTTVNLPASITTIKTGAFRYCKNLFNLTIPDSLTSIIFEPNGKEDGNAFENCGKLPITTRQRLKKLGYTGEF